MSDEMTIRAYDENVDLYKACVAHATDNKALKIFEKSLPRQSNVLDLGCGPAHASVFFREHGHAPDPVDASIEMVEQANLFSHIGARQATFDDIDMISHYDGVWANFSLLHAERKDFPAHLKALFAALKSPGIFHLAMKLGDGTKRDRLNRRYTYYTENELKTLLTEAGFEITRCSTYEGQGLAGTIDPCITILARKH